MKTALAAAPPPAHLARALFINSGILGHRSVAGLIKDAVAMIQSIDATHIDLSRDLTLADRVIRRVFSLPFSPKSGALGNLDLRRWREEMNVGLLAARRIAAEERARGAFRLLHFHTQAAAYGSLARMKRTPSIVSIDATQQLASLEATTVLGRLTYQPNIARDARVFAAASTLTVTSEWAARDLFTHYPECRDKVHVMPYPVRVWCDDDWVVERFLRFRSRPDRPVRVLFMGGDFPRKGGPDLLDAWRGAQFGGKAHLDLVTDWPVAEEEMPSGVSLHRGIRPNTPEWIARWREADIFVMPTRHEAFGMVFQEAGAAGLPVVATRINAIPEIVQERCTGILVEPGDRRTLVDAIRTLVDSPDLRYRMGNAALERARLFSSPERYARRLESIMQWVVDHHG